MEDEFLVFTMKELFARQVETILYLKEQVAFFEAEFALMKKNLRMLKMENSILQSNYYRAGNKRQSMPIGEVKNDYFFSSQNRPNDHQNI